MVAIVPNNNYLTRLSNTVKAVYPVSTGILTRFASMHLSEILLQII